MKTVQSRRTLELPHICVRAVATTLRYRWISGSGLARLLVDLGLVSAPKKGPH
jgi:hypothetical protein